MATFTAWLIHNIMIAGRRPERHQSPFHAANRPSRPDAQLIGLTVAAVISVDLAQAGRASWSACPFLSFVLAGSTTVSPTLTPRLAALGYAGQLVEIEAVAAAGRTDPVQ